MADEETSTATDTPHISPETQDYYEFTKAGLTQDEVTQYEATLAPHLADGTLTQDEIYQAKTDAEATHDAMLHAHNLQHEQGVHAEEGDFATAQSNSQDAGWFLKVADEHGGEAAHPTIDAQQDHQYTESQNLSIANSQAQSANADASTAVAYANVGDVDHAAQYHDSALDHADAAADHGTAGDHGAVGSESHTDTTTPAAETSGETTVEA